MSGTSSPGSHRRILLDALLARRDIEILANVGSLESESHDLLCIAIYMRVARCECQGAAPNSIGRVSPLESNTAVAC